MAITLFTMAVAFAMVALICYRWFSWSEPSSMVSVEGDAACNGVVVEITELSGGGKGGRKIPVELNEANGYAARFFLEAGYYAVVARRDDAPPFKVAPFDLLEHRKLTIPIAGRFPSTAPAATAETTRSE